MNSNQFENILLNQQKGASGFAAQNHASDKSGSAVSKNSQYGPSKFVLHPVQNNHQVENGTHHTLNGLAIPNS